MNSDILIQVKDLKKHFSVGALFKKKKTVYAVDGINFFIKKNSVFGLVGESGCGKSTVGKLVLRLLEPTNGTVHFKKENIFNLSKKEMRNLRKNMQMVFQDPFTSLNPKMTMGEIIKEPILVHKLYDNKQDLNLRVFELIKLVGLNVEHDRKYPHEFSGGQRQRIAIARAIAINPSFIVADEPVSSLDAFIQLQVLDLMKDLQKKLNLTYLFISHDLSVVKYMCDTVAVMYLGKIIEMGDTFDVFNNPKHPFTQALISAIPISNPRMSEKKKRIVLKGEVPSPINPPKGCNFHTRCSYKKEICMQVEPEFMEIESEHFVSCHLW